MTKPEAIEAMEQGEKVRHRSFTDEEWMTIRNGKFLFEDGCICEFSRFWVHREDPTWNDNWSIVKNQ